MGLTDKTRGWLQSAMSDEVIRSVDTSKSSLPNWTPDEPEEKEKPSKESKTKPKSKKPASKKGKSSKPQAKPQTKTKRSIAEFDTWEDDQEDAPSEVAIDSFPKSSSEGLTPADPVVDGPLPIGEDEDEDDGYLDSLEEKAYAEVTAWDPTASDSEDDDDEDYDALFTENREPSSDYMSPQDSSPTDGSAETPQSTASYDDPSDDDEPALSFPVPERPTYEPERPERMPLHEETRYEHKSADEFVRDYSDTPIDLSRAISLDALDAITFPEADNGYSKANVDAMMSFLRLSLSLYIRQTDNLNKTVASLAAELEERSEKHEELAKRLESQVDSSLYDAAVMEQERLESVVTSLARELGRSPSEFIGSSSDTDENTELVF